MYDEPYFRLLDIAYSHGGTTGKSSRGDPESVWLPLLQLEKITFPI